jgi:hypothetical protein
VTQASATLDACEAVLLQTQTNTATDECMYVCMCVCVWRSMSVRPLHSTHIFTYIHTHTHTHRRSRRQAPLFFSPHANNIQSPTITDQPFRMCVCVYVCTYLCILLPLHLVLTSSPPLLSSHIHIHTHTHTHSAWERHPRFFSVEGVETAHSERGEFSTGV